LRDVSDSQPMSARPDQATLLAFFGVVLFGGANAVAVKLTVDELAPFWGAGLRFVAAGSLMMLIVSVTRRSLPRGRSLWGAALYGLVGFAASYGLAYAAIRDVPAGTAMVFISLTPLFTFGLAIAHRQEQFHLQGLLGALIAVVGIGIVFVDQLSANVPLFSLLLILLAAVAIAESGVIVKWIPRSDPFATNGVAMLVGATVLLALSLVAGEALALPTQTATWAAVGYLVVFGSVVMFSLYVFALQRWTASAVSYVTLLMPIVTVALAVVLTGERITPPFVLGSAVILSGVYVGAFLRRGREGGPELAPAPSLPECLPMKATADADSPVDREPARA
jgi:drug/metabolite transporter (DMT)-like permease